MKAIKHSSEDIFRECFSQHNIKSLSKKKIGAYSQDTVNNLSTVFNVFSLLFWPYIH